MGLCHIQSMSEHDPDFLLAFPAKSRLPSIAGISPKPIKTEDPRRRRHDAITGKIGGWKDYKRWAETVRGSWDPDTKK